MSEKPISETTDAEREKQIRKSHDRYPRFPDPDCNVCFLLALLDKERVAYDEWMRERAY